MLDKVRNLPKKYLIAALVIIIILVLLAIRFLAKPTQEGEGAFPTSTPSYWEETTPSPTSTLTPTPTVTPKPSPTVTPTPKPTPTPTPTSQTKTLSSNTSLDGFQSSNGGGNLGVEIRAGRNTNLITRGFISFDLSSIPSSATVESVTLRLYQTGVVGTPYDVGGRLKIDHLDFGSSLENADYNTPSISASFTTLTDNPTAEWKEADVTDTLRNDLTNSRPRSQFRIHFATENIGGTVSGDFAYFESADNSTGTSNIPQLVVKYH
jgi:hypothetical protein